MHTEILKFSVFTILLLFFSDWPLYIYSRRISGHRDSTRHASMPPEPDTGVRRDVRVLKGVPVDHGIWSNSSLPLHIPVDCIFPQSECAGEFVEIDTHTLALEAFNARPLAARTRLVHDSQDHCSIPVFFFAPSGAMSVPAEIIRQREIVRTIDGKAEALRQHKFKVDLSFKASFPMTAPDTIETCRHITEETYHSAWSDVIDAECRKFPMECLMNDVTRMKLFEAERKRHLLFVEGEVWELYKLTMDLHADTLVLVGACRDTATLQRALMNPVLQNAQRSKTACTKGLVVKQKMPVLPAKGRITFDP